MVTIGFLLRKKCIFAFTAPDNVQYRQRPSSIGLQALNGNDSNPYLLPPRQRLSASPRSSHHSRATSLYCDSVIVENEMSEFATRVRRIGMLCLLGAFVIIFLQMNHVARQHSSQTSFRRTHPAVCRHRRVEAAAIGQHRRRSACRIVSIDACTVDTRSIDSC